MKNLIKLVKYELQSNIFRLVFALFAIAIYEYWNLGFRSGVGESILIGFVVLIISDNFQQIKLANLVLLPTSMKKIFCIKVSVNMALGFILSIIHSIYRFYYVVDNDLIDYGNYFIFKILFFIALYSLYLAFREVILRVKLNDKFGKTGLLAILVFTYYSIRFLDTLGFNGTTMLLGIYGIIYLTIAYKLFIKRKENLEFKNNFFGETGFRPTIQIKF